MSISSIFALIVHTLATSTQPNYYYAAERSGSDIKELSTNSAYTILLTLISLNGYLPGRDSTLENIVSPS